MDVAFRVLMSALALLSVAATVAAIVGAAWLIQRAWDMWKRKK